MTSAAAVSKKAAAGASTSLPWDHPAHLISTWFGFGKISRFANGTWGSLGAFPLVAFIFAITSPENTFLGLLVATIIVYFAGLWAVEEYIGGNKKSDPKNVVVDEVAGQMLAVTLVTINAGPISAPQVVIPYVIIFFLFRFFDIWKPWPCNHIDRNVKGAVGVMLDDIVAAIYAVFMFYALAMLMILVLVGTGTLNINHS